MDKLEKLLAELDAMPEEERNREMKLMEEDCICPICPTHNECAKQKGELLFCIIGKSEECITKEITCMCPPCPFARRLDFGALYTTYCIRGSEMEQRGMNK